VLQVPANTFADAMDGLLLISVFAAENISYMAIALRDLSYPQYDRLVTLCFERNHAIALTWLLDSFPQFRHARQLSLLADFDLLFHALLLPQRYGCLLPLIRNIDTEARFLTFAIDVVETTRPRMAPKIASAKRNLAALKSWGLNVTATLEPTGTKIKTVLGPVTLVRRIPAAVIDLTANEELGE